MEEIIEIFFFVLVLVFIYKVIVLELFFMDFFNLVTIAIVFLMVVKKLDGMIVMGDILSLLKILVDTYIVKR